MSTKYFFTVMLCGIMLLQWYSLQTKDYWKDRYHNLIKETDILMYENFDLKDTIMKYHPESLMEKTDTIKYNKSPKSYQL